MEIDPILVPPPSILDPYHWSSTIAALAELINRRNPVIGYGAFPTIRLDLYNQDEVLEITEHIPDDWWDRVIFSWMNWGQDPQPVHDYLERRRERIRADRC